MKSRSACDDNVEMDGSLQAADAMHTSFSSERTMRLMEKQMEAHRRQAAGGLFQQSSQAVRADESLCCVCENCGYVFYRQDDSEFFSCPHCQARHHFEPAEEVYVIQETKQNQDRLERLMMKEKAVERKKQMLGMPRVTAQDTRVNDAKTQSSLEMGSDEYQAYVEDIQQNDPMKPDDEFHEDLEARNADHGPNADEPEESEDGQSSGHLIERKAQSEASKREIHDEVVAALTVEAAATKTKADDLRVAWLSEDNPVLRDVSVSDDEYENALEDFVGMP